MQKPSILLIVDDDTNIRYLLVSLLEDEGYTVVEAHNGQEGLAALSTVQPALVLLDIQMPVMTGWTFLEQRRENDMTVPVIAMSAQKNMLSQAMELGAVDYLDKPFELDELLTKVAKYARPSLP